MQTFKPERFGVSPVDPLWHYANCGGSKVSGMMSFILAMTIFSKHFITIGWCNETGQPNQTRPPLNHMRQVQAISERCNQHEDFCVCAVTF
ncbi:hypothetical protein F2P81_003835 [Scophthalmus maximus]|uniref:Uncharacterized protein n=1 Tax=Scophthalmus maximus TaxID=52904 RepID=A0A6A4TDM7_SCOMX|nr:hypothetical protein F2P81_003835 [Scophthalmus maximus]